MKSSWCLQVFEFLTTTAIFAGATVRKSSKTTPSTHKSTITSTQKIYNTKRSENFNVCCIKLRPVW